MRAFEGDDLTQGNRIKMQQMQMNDWIVQQQDEKNRITQMKKEEQAKFDEQSKHFNQLLTNAEQDHHNRRRDMLKAMQEENLLLAKQKKDREAKAKNDASGYENGEVGYTNTNNFVTENPATQQSMLAAHRVIPYHFKGFNQDQ